MSFREFLNESKIDPAKFYDKEFGDLEYNDLAEYIVKLFPKVKSAAKSGDDVPDSEVAKIDKIVKILNDFAKKNKYDMVDEEILYTTFPEVV